ncbi:ubiquitin carboxyl-terminal hydrolase 16-like isoform X2 [Dysidea avara]|uniref:ubiquitin carboxyl-terminal hydrolase 16-like isoform X2 n=1 Tax=Dysidea avara TaxID=196820 RepID=UPI00333222B6
MRGLPGSIFLELIAPSTHHVRNSIIMGSKRCSQDEKDRLLQPLLSNTSETDHYTELKPGASESQSRDKPKRKCWVTVCWWVIFVIASPLILFWPTSTVVLTFFIIYKYCCKHKPPDDHPPEESPSQPSTPSDDGKHLGKEDGPPVKKMKNLGNTCYVNSMLQSVNQTSELHLMFSNWRIQTYIITIPNVETVEVVVSDTFGPLTQELFEFFGQIHLENHPVVAAYGIVRELRKRNPRFGRGTEEDSHEALRCLLDGLKMEEIDKIKKFFCVKYGVTKDPDSQKHLDGEEKLMLKQYLRLAAKQKTPIETIVGGVQVSTTICRECFTAIQNEEKFFDISLSLPAIKPHTVTEYAIYSLSKSGTHNHGNDSLIAHPSNQSSIPSVPDRSADISIIVHVDSEVPVGSYHSQEDEQQFGDDTGVHYDTAEDDFPSACNSPVNVEVMDDAETHSSSKEHSTTSVITNDEGNKSNKTVCDDQRYPDKENSLDGDGKQLTVACINHPHNIDKSDIHAPTMNDQDVDQDKEFIVTTSVKDPMNGDQDVLPSNKQDQYANSYLTIAQHTEDPKEDSGTYLDARQYQDEKLDHDIKLIQADVDSKFGNSHAEFNPDTGHTEFEVAVNKAKLNKYLEHKCMHFQPKSEIENESLQLTGLESSLQDFTDLDILSDDNKFICNTCTENCTKTQSDTEALCLVSKQITIHHLPQILILHVKRFTIESDGVFKDGRHISFPYKLNMSPYCTSECLKDDF